MEEALQLRSVQRIGSLIVRAAVLAIVATVLPSNGSAQDDTEAKKRASILVDEGNQLFEKKEYERALDKYTAAYQNFGSPKILLNLAEANRHLGNTERAARYYEQFLDETKDEGESKHRKLATDRLADLVAQLGHVAIETSISGVTISIDREKVGKTPLQPVRVEPGRREIRAEHMEYEPFVTNVIVRAGKTERVQLDLNAIAPTPPIGAAPPPEPEREEASETAEVTPTESITAEPVTTVRAKDDEPSAIGKYWWVVAIAGAAVIAGVAIGVASGGGDDFVPGGELGRSNVSEWERFLIAR
jgi:hypothetical protein